MKRNILILLLILGGTISVFAQKNVSNGKIICTSDVHFNPFFDHSLVVTLIKTPYKLWPSVFAKSKIQTANSWGSDSNYPLVKSALDAMQKQTPSPAFIIITGDFLCHSFKDSLLKCAPQYTDSLESFISKTTNLVAWMFDQHFPKTVVLPVLGNNDSYCGDYHISPIGSFLTMFAKAWVPLQRNHNAALDNAFIKQFTGHGYYTYALRDGSGGTMVMLNDIYMSLSYSDKCGDPTLNPAATELTWLGNVLKQAAAKNKKVWIADHIPPGVNVYSTVGKTNSCPQTVQLMMTDSSNKVFVGLMNTYHSTINASFSGHTHMDDFRVLYSAANVPISFIHITPAISPLFYNNPGFQIVEYSKTTFQLLNSQTYYYPLNLPQKAWTLEYDFQKTYGVTGINPITMDQVRQKILANPAYRANYVNYYDMSYPAGNGNNQVTWKGYWCGTGNFFGSSFEACNCGTATK